MGDVNRLLDRIADDDAEAIDGLVVLFQDDLRRDDAGGVVAFRIVGRR